MSSILNRILVMLRTRRINVFLVFLVVAFSILIINKLSNNYTNTVRFKLNLTNIPNDIVLENVEDLNIPVRFENTGFSWLKYVFKQPILDLDFQEDFKQNTNFYSWSVIKNEGLIIKTLPRFSNNIKFVTDEIKINYDKLASKKVPVVSNIDINFMSGYNTLSDLFIVPDSVVIVGSRAEVDKIKKIKTKALNLQDISNSIVQNIELELDSLSQFVSTSTKKVKLSMAVEPFTEGIIKMPIAIINKPQDLDITFFPKYVNVSFYLPLNNYKSVTKEDFEVVCDYNKISNFGTFLKPELIIGTNKVKTARIKESKIEFIITK